MERLKALRSFAKDMEDKGYTVSVFHEDKLIIRLGKDAKGLLSFFGVEVGNLKTLLQFLEE
ncbi:MAG: hypothetical protein QME59_02045 [Candidatus Hydrothermarchaeota archaeon]|nr:hypothetical protein [Candidatus Hydrothermarchaeota archaeon]